jgi:predicted TIM-barrel enzyme
LSVFNQLPVIISGTSKFKQVDAGKLRTVAVNTHGEIFVRTGITDKNLSGTGWK